MIRRRPLQKRNLSPKLLIVTEGEQSERKYIAAVRILRSIPAQRVDMLRHECTDPLSLVEQVVRARKDRIYIGTFDAESGDEAWAVFDVDEHRQHNTARFNQAVALAEKEGVTIAASNPCFELWLILHYVLHTADINRRDALARIKQELPRFDKTLPEGETATLLQRLEAAFANAAVLRKRNNEMPPPIDRFRNPSTAFDSLIARIIALA